MTTTDPRPETDAREETRTRPRLAPGVELLGPYEHSGYREPPLMVRRPDNQLVQLPPLLYLVAQRLDGDHDAASIGEEVGEQIGRQLEGEDVAYLIEEKLMPLGIVASPDGQEQPEGERVTPLLALRLRKGVIPERVVRAVARVFSVFFWPPILLLAIGGFIAFDVWLFGVHGVAAGAREALYRPGLLLVVLGLVILGAIFHEIGHAAACRYGGADPGLMGVGLYIVWPAFYTDVTDAYRLGRGGRLRTDLGGVYFNALFILGLGGVYTLTGIESLLVVALLLHFEMAHQMLPFLRLDGYYVVADLVGVPDLFQRIRPILMSFVPWVPTDPRVKDLKPWVRFAVTGWVLVVVPVILFQMVMVVTVTPRLFGTAFDSMASIWNPMVSDFGSGRSVQGAAGVVQLLVLILPLAGIVYLFSMLAVRFVRGWRDTKGRPVARGMLSVTGLAVVAFVAFAWWPEPSRYTPIQEDEQWTLPQVVAAAAQVSTGGGGTVLLPNDHAPGSGPIVTDGTTEPSPSPGSTSTTGTDPSPSPSSSPSPTPSPSPTVSPSPSPSQSPSPTP
jgi:putative peptide zinc metalloprotease protein